jgi:putative ubiquitin-RnfH superfamily antitoxin RatB of RatAB toxin-antitoxin module
MPEANSIPVELAFADAIRQELISMTVPVGTTVGQVIDQSPLAQAFPNVDLAGLATGIWGNLVSRDQKLVAGDRIELYRPLLMDPRDARRALAAQGKFMGTAGKRR